MLTTLPSIAHHGGCKVDDPRVQRVRDFPVRGWLQELLAARRNPAIVAPPT